MFGLIGSDCAYIFVRKSHAGSSTTLIISDLSARTIKPLPCRAGEGVLRWSLLRVNQSPTIPPLFDKIHFNANKRNQRIVDYTVWVNEFLLKWRFFDSLKCLLRTKNADVKGLYIFFLFCKLSINPQIVAVVLSGNWSNFLTQPWWVCQVHPREGRYRVLKAKISLTRKATWDADVHF